MRADELFHQRTQAWSESDRTALAEVVAALRPSARHLTDMLEWIEDVGVRDEVAPATLLAEAELRAALGGPGSAADRLKRWKTALRRRRYPRLAARERAVAEAVRGLELEPTLRVAPPRDLEGGALTVTMSVASRDQLAAALSSLRARLDDGGFARVFDLLDEA